MRTNVAEGDNVRVRSSYILDTGQVIDAPDVVLPLAGGSHSVDLPGGGSLTLSVVQGNAAQTTTRAIQTAP
jgi:hypothetical protein